MNRGDVSDARLASLWASAFARSLRLALARAGPGDANVIQSSTRADWLARWIVDLMTGTCRARWEYDEFHSLEGLPPAARRPLFYWPSRARSPGSCAPSTLAADSIVSSFFSMNKTSSC